MANWFKIIRPGTLLAAAAPVTVGLSVAHESESIHLWTATVTLITALSIQVLSNLINDYADYRKGADGEGRLGPQRAISAGLVTPLQMKRAIAMTILIALIGGAFLIFKGGWPIAAIGVSGLLFAWLYSASSFSLSYLGIADLFVLLYFGPIATVGTTYLQTSSFSPTSLLLGIGCGVISMGVLTVNNTRDYEQDRRHGKRTIIVRRGLLFAKIYYTLLMILPGLLLLFADRTLGAVLYIPFALMLSLLFYRTQGREFNRLLILTGLLNALFAITVVLFS